MSNEFSRSCFQQGQNGEMLFCGSDGITAFFPENVRDNPYVPPVVITSFKILNKPVPIGAESVLKKAIPYVDSLTLSYRHNVFSFEFAALSYANSHKNRYRYKLEGFDPGWNEVGSNQRLAIYTNLDPAKYVFRVQGSNSDGVWNEEGVSLPILITPPWYKTNWFRSALRGRSSGAAVGSLAVPYVATATGGPEASRRNRNDSGDGLDRSSGRLRCVRKQALGGVYRLVGGGHGRFRLDGRSSPGRSSGILGEVACVPCCWRAIRIRSALSLRCKRGISLASGSWCASAR